jgi:carbon monoxide dehydrogenase subunit G
MTLERSVTTQTQIGVVWTLINDLERLAGCLPGLTQPVGEGAGLAGKLALRVGSQQVTYAGGIAVEASDPATHQLSLRLTGAEARGTGEASATARIRLRDNGSGTVVDLAVTPAGSGRIASFDPDAVRAAGDRLLDRFVAALVDLLPAEQAGPTEPVNETSVPVADTEPAESAAASRTAESLATVTSITDVVRSRSASRRGAAASAVALVAALITLWVAYRRRDA